MRRREFVKLVAVTVLWPTTISAQNFMPRVGILDPGLSHLFDAFFSGMRDLGYIEGQNISYIRRSSTGQSELIAQLAAQLVDAKPDVIVTAGPVPVLSLMKATSTIPIVFAALGDALATGVVSSLSHPERNATGFSFLNTEISVKRLEILHELVPHARQIALLRDPKSVGADLKQTVNAAEAIGIETQVFEVTSPDEYEGAFAEIVTHAGAIDVLGSPFFNANRELLTSLAARYRLPAIYETSEYVRSGGLISYGPSLADLFHRAAGYVTKLLHGEKLANLPVEQPTRFELVINLKTAKALGLTMPHMLLAGADEVIE